MSSTFQKKSSQIFLTVFIGIIVISFMFSGPFGGSGTPDSIGAVGPHSIKVREFNGEVQRQSQFYAQFFKGGQPLSTNELKQYKIYDNAIKNLVYQKLGLILADEVGIIISDEAIKADIKNATYFKTNEKFDINKYKALLSYNKITPEDFERDTENRLMSARLGQIVTKTPLTTEFKKTLDELFKNKKTLQTVTLNNSSLRNSLKITSSEIKDFLKKENNKKKVESIFKQRQASLGVAEQVKARHILVKDAKDALVKANKIKKEVNAKNFVKLAKKYTDEEQGKANGGDLNWVKRGQMVKEFETALFNMKKGEIVGPIKTQFGYHVIFAEDKKKAKPAVYEKFESKLASELIQKEKNITELLAKAKKEIESQLKAKGAISKSLEKKYGLSVKKDNTINQLEGFGTSAELSTETLTSIFKDNKNFGIEDKEVKTVFYTASEFKGNNDVDFDLKPVQNILAQQSQKAMLDKLSKKYTFKQNKYARLPNQ